MRSPTQAGTVGGSEGEPVMPTCVVDLPALAGDAVRQSGVPAFAARVIGSGEHPPVSVTPARVLHVLTRLIESVTRSKAEAERTGVTIRIEPLTAPDGASMRLTVEPDGRSPAGDWPATSPENGARADAPCADCADLCRSLTAPHGGSFGIDHLADGGCRVWLTLPVSGDAAVDPSVPKHIHEQRRRLRLLVVEDNDINREILLRMLERSGYQVVSVADGRAAVEVVAAGGVDGALMDLHMPDMNGFEATRLIRSLAGSAGHTPVIALTADSVGAVRARAEEAGVDAFLAKPVNWQALVATLDRLAVPSSLKRDAEGLRAEAEKGAGGTVPDPLLDRQQIGQIADRVGSDRAAALNARLFGRMQSDLAGMRAAIAEGTLDRIGVLAHSAKGSCGMLGWCRCAAVLDRLQGLGGDASGTMVLISALESALDDTRLALDIRTER